MKERVYAVLEAAREGDRASRIFDLFLIVLIISNVIAVILETVQSVQRAYADVFRWFETISVIIFTVEYMGRLWTCTLDERYRHPVTGRIRFALTPMLIIDLLAILPYYVPMLIGVDLRFIRALRIFRLVRLLKLSRYSTAMIALSQVLREKKEELLITVTTIIVLLIIASSFMYYIEHEAQPDAFSSIPATMWWGIATLTTVGYGDVYPVTGLGRLFGACIAILGIGIFALPAGIIASGFVAYIEQKKKGEQDTCPHCGKELPGNR